MPTIPDDYPLPEWAISYATSYMEVGAALPTKDGRRTGNATIVSLENSPIGQLAVVVTDAGNEMRLTELELAELFHPPIFISRGPPCREKT